MLFALPLMATAAATAHQLMVESTPLSLNVQTPSAVDSAIGLARVHSVALNRNGSVEGRIASIENGTNEGLASLKVFFVQNGEVVSETTTQSDGSFVAQSVPEGAYSFVATGENGFAAYGVRVVSDATGKLDNLMQAAAVSPNMDSVKQIIKEKLPSEVTEQILSTVVSEDRVVGANRVRLNDGQLQGSVVALLGDENTEGTYVHIIKDNTQVAEVQADESGSFMVKDLEPGVYDFVAAGPSGFAAVSFEAVQDEETPSVLSEGEVADLVDTDELPVSIEPGLVEPGFVEPGFVVADPITYQDAILADIPYDAGFSDSLDVCLTCGQDAGFVSDQVFSEPVFAEQPIFQDAPIEYAGESVGCGCASGGCCGAEANFSNFSSCNTCNPAPNPCCGGGGRRLFSGAGGSGGGGLRRLLLIGGLAGAIIAIADDDSVDESPFGS